MNPFEKVYEDRPAEGRPADSIPRGVTLEQAVGEFMDKKALLERLSREYRDAERAKDLAFKLARDMFHARVPKDGAVILDRPEGRMVLAMIGGGFTILREHTAVAAGADPVVEEEIPF